MNYTDENRGIIQNRERARQINDFRNLRMKRNITPTDIDGYFEYDDKAFIFYELKHGEARPSHGQSLAFTRIVDAINETGKDAVLFLCSHDVDDPEQDVDAAESKVVGCYLGKKTAYFDDESGTYRVWRKDQKHRNARQITVDFLKYALGDEAVMIVPDGDLQ